MHSNRIRKPHSSRGAFPLRDKRAVGKNPLLPIARTKQRQQSYRPPAKEATSLDTEGSVDFSLTSTRELPMVTKIG